MTDAPADGLGAGDTLHRIAVLLAASVASLEQAGGAGAERLAGLVRPALQALEAAAEGVAGVRAADMRQWLDDVREAVTAIAGWVRMLRQVPRESTRIRAAEAIERNVQWLGKLLAHQPR